MRVQILSFISVSLICCSSFASTCSDSVARLKKTHELLFELRKVISPAEVTPYKTDDFIRNTGIHLNSNSLQNINPGMYAFVVPSKGENTGRILIGERHADLGAKEVFAAGELVIRRDKEILKVVEINNKSGTFRPNITMILPSIDALLKAGIQVNHMRFKDSFGIIMIEFINGRIDIKQDFFDWL